MLICSNLLVLEGCPGEKEGVCVSVCVSVRAESYIDCVWPPKTAVIWKWLHFLLLGILGIWEKMKFKLYNLRKLFLSHSNLRSVKILSTVGARAQVGNWGSLLSFKQGCDTVRFVFSPSLFSNRLWPRDAHGSLSPPRGNVQLSSIRHCIFAESDGLSWNIFYCHRLWSPL